MSPRGRRGAMRRARAARANAEPAAAPLTKCVRVSGVEEYPIGAARLARARVAAPSLAGGCADSWERPWLPPRVCGSPLTHRVLRGGRNVSSDLVRGHPPVGPPSPRVDGNRRAVRQCRSHDDDATRTALRAIVTRLSLGTSL
ncbi:hypothetical protein MRX96_014392 [Rhipicephalus microplus]